MTVKSTDSELSEIKPATNPVDQTLHTHTNPELSKSETITLLNPSGKNDPSAWFRKPKKQKYQPDTALSNPSGVEKKNTMLFRQLRKKQSKPDTSSRLKPFGDVEEKIKIFSLTSEHQRVKSDTATHLNPSGVEKPLPLPLSQHSEIQSKQAVNPTKNLLTVKSTDSELSEIKPATNPVDQTLHTHTNPELSKSETTALLNPSVEKMIPLRGSVSLKSKNINQILLSQIHLVLKKKNTMLFRQLRKKQSKPDTSSRLKPFGDVEEKIKIFSLTSEHQRVKSDTATHLNPSGVEKPLPLPLSQHSEIQSKQAVNPTKNLLTVKSTDSELSEIKPATNPVDQALHTQTDSESSKIENLKQRKKARNKRTALGAIGIMGGVPTAMGIAGLAAYYSSKGSGSGTGSKLYSGPVLTPSNTESPILNNGHSTQHGSTIPRSANELVSAPKAMPLKKSANPIAQASDSVTKHSGLKVKRAHTMRKTIVYIVATTAVALLLIVAGIFVLKMQQATPKKEDLFTDMNQYYTNGSINANPAMSTIYPNASLKQRKNVI